MQGYFQGHPSFYCASPWTLACPRPPLVTLLIISCDLLCLPQTNKEITTFPRSHFYFMVNNYSSGNMSLLLWFKECSIDHHEPVVPDLEVILLPKEKKPASLDQLVAWLFHWLGGTGFESKLGWPFIFMSPHPRVCKLWPEWFPRHKQ